jgi:hypothetical protein
MGNFELNFEQAHVGGVNVGAGGTGGGGGGLQNISIPPINNGERSSSPTSPTIAIPERRYTPAEEAVLTKFVDFVKTPGLNDKPYLDEKKDEKFLLSRIYYLRQTQDLLQRAFRQLGIHKEQATLDANYEKMLKRKPGYPNSRSRIRKSRNRKQRKTRKQ